MEERFIAFLQTGQPIDFLSEALIIAADTLLKQDIETNRRLGSHGEPLIPDGARILTHCNAGALATGGYGTALGVIRAAWERGKRLHVYVDETRPVFRECASPLGSLCGKESLVQSSPIPWPHGS